MQVVEQVSVANNGPAHAGRERFGTRAAWHTPERDESPAQLDLMREASGRGTSSLEPALSRVSWEARRDERRIEPGLLLLVQAQSPIRRALAALAGRFVFIHGWERLGFARLGDYGAERLGLSARSLYDLAYTDRVLGQLPEIDHAFVRGEIPWTKVRLLARVASGGDEEKWLALARGMTSAALAKEVRAADVGTVERSELAVDTGTGKDKGKDGQTDRQEDTEDDWENVKIRCASPVQGKWYRARQLAWRMAGRPVKPWECGEMVAAEVLSAIEMEPEAADAVGEEPNAVGEKADPIRGGVGAIGQEADAATRAGQIEQEVGHTAHEVGLLEVPARSTNGHSAWTNPGVEHEAMPSISPPGSMLAFSSQNGRTAPDPGSGDVDPGRMVPDPDRTAPASDEATPGSVTTAREAPGAIRSTSTPRPELPPHLESLLTDLDDADAFELDARLREAVAFDQRLDAEIGGLLAVVAHEQLYACHGFRSMEHYARERLGMAAGKARTLLRLERAGGFCRALTEAYREGRLSWVQAGALAPVVLSPHGDLPNREAWVRWATQISVRRLREDVDRALLLNQTEPERFAATGGLPAAAGYGGEKVNGSAGDGRVTAGGPSAGWIGAGGAISAGGTAGRATDEGAAVGCTAARAASAGAVVFGDTTANGTAKAADSGKSSDRQIGAQPRVSQEDTYLFFHAPSSVARLFRAVLCTVRRRIERQTGKLPTEGEAFEAMLDHVFEVWGGYGQRTRATHRVFERDGWRCTAPGCSSLTNLHDHHIVFRSAGGSNDLSNRTTLCVWHHLRGVHGGVVRCVGKAPHELRFELGVRPGARPLLGFEAADRRAGISHGRALEA